MTSEFAADLTLSVLMTVYNGEQHLDLAVQSVLNEADVPLELIIIDDGSSDNSSLIAAHFSCDPRVTTINLTENRGRVHALNLALSVARGRYVSIMDADDISLPGRYSRQLQVLESDESIGILGGQIRHFGSWGGPTRNVVYPVDEVEIRAWIDSGAMPLAHSTMVARRELLEKLGGYSDRCKRAEDLELVIRANHYGRVLNLDGEPLVDYRVAKLGQPWSYWVENERHRRWAVLVAQAAIEQREPPVRQPALSYRVLGELCIRFCLHRARTWLKKRT